MIGVITGRDILAHPIVTIRCFGWQTFFRALFAGQGRTFLSLLQQNRHAEEIATRLSALVDQCIDLEMRAKRVYTTFAHAFSDRPAASKFFDTLAKHEQCHAELLLLCRAAARTGGWMTDCFNPWESYVPCLQQHMDEIDASLYRIDSLDDAFRLVVQIESGEINRVFQGVLASCNSAFVKKITAFRRAVEHHISYIAIGLPELDSRLVMASRELRALFPPER
jgi:hypothetical protein